MLWPKLSKGRKQLVGRDEVGALGPLLLVLVTFLVGCQERKNPSPSPISKKEKGYDGLEAHLKKTTRKWCLNHFNTTRKTWNSLKRRAKERAFCYENLTNKSRFEDFENCLGKIVYTLERIREEEPYINSVLDYKDCQEYDNKSLVQDQALEMKEEILPEVKEAREHFYSVFALLQERGRKEMSRVDFLIGLEVLHYLFYKAESEWYPELMSNRCALSRHALFSSEEDQDQVGIRHIGHHYDQAHVGPYMDYFTMKKRYGEMQETLNIAKYGQEEECDFKDVEKQFAKVRLKEAEDVISHFEQLNSGEVLEAMCEPLRNTKWMTEELEPACQSPATQVLEDEFLIKTFSDQLGKLHQGLGEL